MNPQYNQYLKDMKRLKASLPYMREKDFCEAHGLQYGEEETQIFIARKSSSAKEIEPTLSSYVNLKVK